MCLFNFIHVFFFFFSRTAVSEETVLTDSVNPSEAQTASEAREIDVESSSTKEVQSLTGEKNNSTSGEHEEVHII